MFTPRPRLSLLIAATTIALAACDAFATRIDPNANPHDGTGIFDAGFPFPPVIIEPPVPPSMCPSWVSIWDRTPNPNAIEVDRNTAITWTFSLPILGIDGANPVELHVEGDNALVPITVEIVHTAFRVRPVSRLQPQTTYRVNFRAHADFRFACNAVWQGTCDERTWTFTTGGIASDADAGADDAGTDDDTGTSLGAFDCY